MNVTVNWDIKTTHDLCLERCLYESAVITKPVIWQICEQGITKSHSSVRHFGPFNLTANSNVLLCRWEGDSVYRQPEQADDHGAVSTCSYLPLWHFLKHMEAFLSRIWILTTPLTLLNCTLKIYPELVQPVHILVTFYLRFILNIIHLNPLSSKMLYFEPFSHHNSLCISCSPIRVLCLAWYAKVITVWRDEIIWPHLVTHHSYIVMRNMYYL